VAVASNGVALYAWRDNFTNKLMLQFADSSTGQSLGQYTWGAGSYVTMNGAAFRCVASGTSLFVIFVFSNALQWLKFDATNLPTSSAVNALGYANFDANLNTTIKVAPNGMDSTRLAVAVSGSTIYTLTKDTDAGFNTAWNLAVINASTGAVSANTALLTDNTATTDKAQGLAVVGTRVVGVVAWKNSTTQTLSALIATTAGASVGAFTLATSIGDQTISSGVYTHASVVANASNNAFIVWDCISTGTTRTTFALEISTAGAVVNAQKILMRGVAIASEAFVSNGVPYVWLRYYSNTQQRVANTNATVQVLNSVHVLVGLSTDFTTSYVVGRTMSGTTSEPTQTVPNVTGAGLASTNKWIFALPAFSQADAGLLGQSAKASAIWSATVDFASERMRSIRLGDNVIFSGGSPSIYDSSVVCDAGCAVFPEISTLTASASGGSLASGTYGYAATYEWTDAKGQLHRSTPSPPKSVTVTGPSGSVQVKVSMPRVQGSAQTPNVVIYRTSANGSLYQRVAVVEVPVDTFYLPTGTQDMSVTDTMSDANQQLGPHLYTVDGEIPDEAPPSSVQMAVRGSRAYAASGTTVYPSKIWAKGYGPAWSSFLTIQIDPSKGDITGIATMDEKTVVFQATGITIIVGDGPDNTGAGSPWSVQPIATDIGCTNPDSIVLTPMGLMFQSAKGIYLLSRDLQVVEIGRQVTAYASTTWSKALVNPNATEVRFLAPAGGNTLVFDWTYGQWGRFSGVSGSDATIWNGSIVLLSGSTSIWQESLSTQYDPGTTTQDRVITFVPLKFAGIQGYQRVRSFEILYQVNPANFDVSYLQIDVAANGDSQWVTYYAGTLGALPYTAGNLQRVSVGLRPDHAKCESLQIRVSEFTQGNGAVVIGEVIALSVTVGVKGGLFRLPASNKVG
jgi:hypothetical protein